jgi:hypothetical protein
MIEVEAFSGDHRRCGEMDGGVEEERAGYRLWMSCLTCDAWLVREPPRS